MEKRWILKPPSDGPLLDIARELNLHKLVAQVLVQRDFLSVDSAKEFIDAKLSGLPQPDDMCGAAKGARRIADAVQNGESICVYGDYDVDGVTSTALLVEFFRKAGYPVMYRLPSRIEEGYGFHSEAVRQLAAEGVKLIITVDCGITGNEACRTASELGVDVIITDHHEILEGIPDAFSVINPHQENCGFHDMPLAGVGVAFFLAGALRAELIRRKLIEKNQVDLRESLDLVTLGTVADVAPIVGVNRILVRHGLLRISQGDRPGIQALKQVARLHSKNVLCGHISFQLAPRINAAGRMGEADAGVELLISRDEQRVTEIAKRLDEENQKRQLVEQEILEDARRQLLNNPHHKDLYSIVLAGKDWHPGVIGIVASRIQEQFYRPTILITFEGGTRGRGSARSISGFNLIEAIGKCDEHLLGYGGHRYAAGVQIEHEKLMDFAVAFERQARKTLRPDDLQPVLEIDAECDLDRIDMQLIKSLSNLAPYGVGNPEPVFVVHDAKVEFKRIVGQDHLKLRIARKKDHITAMAFGMGKLHDRIHNRVDIAFTVGINEYQGNVELQLTVKDLIPIG